MSLTLEKVPKTKRQAAAKLNSAARYLFLRDNWNDCKTTAILTRLAKVLEAESGFDWAMGMEE